MTLLAIATLVLTHAAMATGQDANGYTDPGYKDPGYAGPGYSGSGPGPSYAGPGYSGSGSGPGYSGSGSGPGYGGPGYGGPGYAGPGYAGPGYAGPSYAAVTYGQADLDAAAVFANRIRLEKQFLSERLGMLKDQQTQILDKLDEILAQDLVDLASNQSAQAAALGAVEQRISEALYTVGLGENLAAGAVPFLERITNELPALSALITSGTVSNIRQAGELAAIRVALDEAEEKLNSKLISTTAGFGDQIAGLKSGTLALADLVNTRQCQSESVLVTLGPDGSGEIIYYTDFADIPVVLCVLQGFTSGLKLDESKNPYYGNYANRHENIALTADCKAVAGGIRVKVFDQSQGGGNTVISANVQVKACTFGAQAHAPLTD